MCKGVCGNRCPPLGGPEGDAALLGTLREK